MPVARYRNGYIPRRAEGARGKPHMLVRGKRFDLLEGRRHISRSLQSWRLCDISIFGHSEYTVRIALPAAGI